MLAIDTLAVFFLASLALSLSPGPDNIFVLTQSALHGRLAGVLVTLGLCTGLLFHTAAVALGVATLLQSSALAFAALKLLGAAYLLYLAWQAYRAGAVELGAERAPKLSPRGLYWRGVIMNISNPKVAIFFLAFLPQFIDAERSDIAQQIMALGGVFILAALLVFCGIAWAAGFLGEWLRRSARAQRLLNKTAALVFIALALRLVLLSP